MITNKQLLTFALILTLAPQTTQPSALKDTIKDFATEHPLIVGGTAITLVGVGAFMGGRASRNPELSTAEQTITGLRGQLMQDQNQSNALKKQLQHAQDESAQALKAANSFQDNLRKLFQAAKPNDVIPQNLTIDTLYDIIRGECRTQTLNLEQLRTEVKELKQQLAQTQQELSTLTATSNENFNFQNTLAASREETIRLLKAKIAELEESIRQKDLFIKLTKEANQKSIKQKDALIQLTQKTNTELHEEIIEAYKAILKDTPPGNYAPQNKKNWFTQRDFTPKQQTALNSLIACMQVVASTTNPISGETTESSTVFHDQPHTTRLSTRTVPETADDIFRDKPAAPTTDASAAPATPMPGRKQWTKPTTPVHFDIAATSSDAVTASAAADISQENAQNDPSTTC